MKAKYGRALNEKYFLKFCYPGQHKSLPKIPLTEKQAVVYNYLKDGMTVRDIANMTRLRYSAIQGHVTHIHTKGYLL